MMKLNPALSAHDALTRAEHVFRKYIPDQPIEYHFTDEDYARKFAEEERVGSLATVFAVLAIFISCLGLFGLSSFYGGAAHERNWRKKSTGRIGV